MPQHGSRHGTRRPPTVDPSIKQVGERPVPGNGHYQATQLAAKTQKIPTTQTNRERGGCILRLHQAQQRTATNQVGVSRLGTALMACCGTTRPVGGRR